MDTLKYISLGCISLLMFSCNEYFNKNYSFQSIYLKDWNSSICPNKIVYERYEKNTNFKKMIDSFSDFEIRDCESEMQKYNQRLFTPNTLFEGQINYDIRIVIDDSLEFKITDVRNVRDTTKYVFTLGKKYYIDNAIYSMRVNGYLSNNIKSKRNIELKTKLGKLIKK